MLKEKTISVAVCGVGDRMHYVAKTLKNLIPGFIIIAHADPSDERCNFVANACDDFGLRYKTLDDLLTEHSPEFVLIGSPNSMHLEHMILALKADARVFCEKPVVTTEDQTFQVLDLIREYGEEKILVGLVLRYAPLYKALMKAKADGVFGDIISIEASEHIAPEHGAFFMRDWRRDVNLNGGFMLEKCCHDLDLYQSVVGARPKRVMSFGNRRVFTPKNATLETEAVFHERKSRWGGVDRVFSSEDGLIDNQVVLIEYEDGVNFCFHTNLNTPDEFRRFCVMGSRGMAEGDFVRNYFQTHDSLSGEKTGHETFDYNDDVSMHYGAEEKMAEEFAEHFYAGVPLPVSVVDALEAGLTAIKIDEARHAGQVLDLTDVWKRFDKALGR